jgi:gliding motility-associated-like protein
VKSLFKITFLGVIILLTFSASAQKEANIWYFGDSAGLDFNTDPPTALLGSQMLILEGCASIADSNGQLLFYTNGMTVWNKQHQVMSNGTGLHGGNSPVQGNIIVQKPGSNHEYYIFTSNDGTTINNAVVYGLTYSIVDMNLSSGLGAVTTKNVLIADTVRQGMCAVKHGNTNSVWIVVSDRNNYTDTLRAFELSVNGVNSTPISSGVNFSTAVYEVLKFSRNGKRAIQRISSSQFLVFDFNDTLGTMDLKYALNVQNYLFGLEFSPSGRYVYASMGGTPYNIVQFDLDAGGQSAVANSAVTMGNVPTLGMQLAPNGKIYCARNNFDSIAVIHHPDSGGLACNYQRDGQYLGGRVGFQRFPQFVQSIFRPQLIFQSEDTCELAETKFIANVFYAETDSIIWDFGDTASTSNDTIGDSVTHVFSNWGPFTVVATAYVNYYEDSVLVHDTLTLTKNIFIHPLPIIDLGNDTILCEGDSLTILNSNTVLNMQYLWSDSTTDEFIQIIEPDTYWVQTSTICGVAFDTIVIDSVLPAFVDLGDDSILCVGDTVTLDGTVAGGYYLWQDNSTDSVFNAFTTGTYTVASSGICNSDTDTINLFFIHPVEDQLPPDTTFCDGETAIFGIQADSASFVWSNGSTDSSISVQLQDSIRVEISNACGTFYDSVIVVIDYPLDPILGPDIVLCLGDTHVYKLNLDGNNQYIWHSGDTADSFIVRDIGQVWVHAMNTCGTFADSVLIDYDRVPMIELPEDTLLCDGKVLPLKVHFSRSSYLWNTGSSDSGIVVTSAGEYSVTATNLCGVDSSDIQVDFDFPLSVDLGPSMYACQGDTIKLGFDVPNNPDYSWNSGYRDSSILVTESGRYVLEITNTCGTYSDDVYAYFQAVPYIGFPNDTVVCGEVGWIITADDAFDSYLWQDGSKDQSMIIDSSGVFSLQAWSDCGEDRDTVTVNIVDSMAISLGVDTVYCNDLGDIVLDAFAPEAVHYEWNTGSSESKLSIDETGFYAVTITDEFGCVATDEVFVDECPHYFYLPNSFTPNGDGVNDVFRAEGEFISDFVMYVFDRWGNMVNETHDLDTGWNGKYKGEMLPSGMYAVHVKYVSDGKIYERHSQISLMK